MAVLIICLDSLAKWPDRRKRGVIVQEGDRLKKGGVKESLTVLRIHHQPCDGEGLLIDSETSLIFNAVVTAT